MRYECLIDWIEKLEVHLDRCCDSCADGGEELRPERLEELDHSRADCWAGCAGTLCVRVMVWLGDLLFWAGDEDAGVFFVAV